MAVEPVVCVPGVGKRIVAAEVIAGSCVLQKNVLFSLNASENGSNFFNE